VLCKTCSNAVLFDGSRIQPAETCHYFQNCKIGLDESSEHHCVRMVIKVLKLSEIVGSKEIFPNLLE
jgi:hypothetical protein